MNFSDLISALKDLHVPVILIGASILFLLIGLGGGIKGMVEIPTISTKQRNLLLCFSVVFLILGIFTASIPTPSTANQATSSSPIPHTAHFVVNANQDLPGLDTGINLTAGEHLSINAQGSAQYGYDVYPCAGYPLTNPDGQRMVDGKTCEPKPGPNSAFIGELLAHISPSGGSSSTGWFAVGSNYSATVPISGRLYLLYNDSPGYYGSNTGNYQVTITVTASQTSKGYPLKYPFNLLPDLLPVAALNSSHIFYPHEKSKQIELV